MVPSWLVSAVPQEHGVCSRGRPRAVEEPGLGFAPLPRVSAASPLSLCPDHAGHAEPGGTGPWAMCVRITGWRR